MSLLVLDLLTVLTPRPAFLPILIPKALLILLNFFSWFPNFLLAPDNENLLALPLPGISWALGLSRLLQILVSDVMSESPYIEAQRVRSALQQMVEIIMVDSGCWRRVLRCAVQTPYQKCRIIPAATENADGGKTSALSLLLSWLKVMPLPRLATCNDWSSWGYESLDLFPCRIQTSLQGGQRPLLKLDCSQLLPPFQSGFLSFSSPSTLTNNPPAHQSPSRSLLPVQCKREHLLKPAQGDPLHHHDHMP